MNNITHVVLLLALALTTTTHAQDIPPTEQACRDRSTGDEGKIAEFCRTERADYIAALVAFVAETGVQPIGIEKCEQMPRLEFLDHMGINNLAEQCNQDVFEGRDLNSCGWFPSHDPQYVILLNQQSNMYNIRRWYTKIQLQKFFWLCTEHGVFPWQNIPSEWA